MKQTLVLNAKRFTTAVDALNRWVGKGVMWLLLPLLGILLWDLFATNVLKQPPIWIMEMSKFTMAAYCLLGAAYTMQQGAHVRMDFLYERWKPRRRSLADSLTSFFLIFYLAMLVVGGWESTAYAIENNQHNRSLWAPPMAPIKIIMTTGVFLMLLQSLSELIKDIFRACGKSLDGAAVAEVGDEVEDTATERVTPQIILGLG
jgi:TRAP-type mannitol/chloroaromatic compound transport system permease small subunit